MKRVIGLAAVLAGAVLVAGCLETRQEFTLNPDGSGKVVYEMLVANPMMAMGDKKPDPLVEAAKMAKQVLDQSKGVETWSDVSCGVAEDGRTKFKGTAYFKDFAKTAFGASGEENAATFVKDDKGGMVLTFNPKPKEDKTKTPEATKPAAPKLTDAEVDAKIKETKQQYAMQRAMMEAVFSKLRMEMAFRLPGTLGEVKGFQKDPSGTVRFVVEGAKLLKAMDDMMADEAALRKAVQAGEKIGEGPPDEMMEKMFGKGPIEARVSGPFKPLFDFAAEVKAAKEAYPAMVERLGLNKLPKEEGATIQVGPPGGKN